MLNSGVGKLVAFLATLGVLLVFMAGAAFEDVTEASNQVGSVLDR